MTEGFSKPDAKTAFFKAIFKFCTANQLFKLPSLIAISVSKNGSELVDFSTVKAILECCSFKRFKSSEQYCFFF